MKRSNFISGNDGPKRSEMLPTMNVIEFWDNAAIAIAQALVANASMELEGADTDMKQVADYADALLKERNQRKISA